MVFSRRLICSFKDAAEGNIKKNIKIDLDDDFFTIEYWKQRKPVKYLDVVQIYTKNDEYVLVLWDGSEMFISQKEPGGKIEDLFGRIAEQWNNYPSYQFNVEAVSHDVHYFNKLQGQQMKSLHTEKRIEGILKLLKCHNYRCMVVNNFAMYFQEKHLSRYCLDLLSRYFFTGLDLSDLKMNDDLIHFCCVGVRVSRELRSLTIPMIKNVNALSILRCVPTVSKLRSLNLECENGLDFLALVRSTKAFFSQLTKLSIYCPKDPDITLSEKINFKTHLSLRDLKLSGLKWANEKVFIDFLRNCNHLRALKLSRCEFDLGKLFNFLKEGKTYRLESLEVSNCGFGTSVDESFFKELKYLQLLKLEGISEGNPANVLKGVLKGLSSVKSPVYDDFLIEIKNCSLDQSAAEAIRSGLPSIRHLTWLSLVDNVFEDNGLAVIIESLPLCERLNQVALSGSKESKNEWLSQLETALSEDKCKVTKLTLRGFDKSTELGDFLSNLAKKGGCGIDNLDIRDCTIKDEQARGIFSLIQSVDPKAPFTLLFNGSCFREHTRRSLENLIESKWRNQTGMKVSIIMQSGFESHVDASQSITNGTPSMLELKKFEEAITTPSFDFCEQDSELTKIEVQLRAKRANMNVDSLKGVCEAINHSEIVLKECEKLAPMQTKLLDAALDPETCVAMVKQVMEEMKENLKELLVEKLKETSQKLLGIVQKECRQSYASLTSFVPEENNGLEEAMTHIFDRQMELSIRSLLYDQRTKLVEEILYKVVKSLNDDARKCLEQYPERSQLIAKPAAENPEYMVFSTQEKQDTGVQQTSFSYSKPSTTLETKKTGQHVSITSSVAQDSRDKNRNRRSVRSSREGEYVNVSPTKSMNSQAPIVSNELGLKARKVYENLTPETPTDFKIESPKLTEGGLLDSGVALGRPRKPKVKPSRTIITEGRLEASHAPLTTNDLFLEPKSEPNDSNAEPLAVSPSVEPRQPVIDTKPGICVGASTLGKVQLRKVEPRSPEPVERTEWNERHVSSGTSPFQEKVQLFERQCCNSRSESSRQSKVPVASHKKSESGRTSGLRPLPDPSESQMPWDFERQCCNSRSESSRQSKVPVASHKKSESGRTSGLRPLPDPNAPTSDIDE